MSAINPSRQENFPQWYQEVIKASDMAEQSSVRGCMVIKPWGYAVWENIQSELDARFKKQGHKNAYFPLLIPLKNLEKEAEHVAGFAKECAVVTHHRLIAEQGKLIPDGKLEEPLVIRPTSETIIGECFANWVDSYRDLPLKINQWANVMRWEMRTRLFLRTSEFLWQEGHTAHETANDAQAMTQQMINTYEDFCKNWLALPVIVGQKTQAERFPGAVQTLCIEAMMQDKKALQAGTSHFLGQTFAKAANITFNNRQGELELAWTTSWGVSTRLIGAVVMAHSDDDGLVLPPTIAPEQVVIMPVFRKNVDPKPVELMCEQIAQQLRNLTWQGHNLRVHVDYTESKGGKHWQWIKKGVPIRIEIGPRDLEQGAAMLARRDQNNKETVELQAISSWVLEALPSIQLNIFNRAHMLQQENTYEIIEWNKSLVENPGFYICYANDCPEMEQAISNTSLTARCILHADEPGKCIFTQNSTNTKIIFAKAY